MICGKVAFPQKGMMWPDTANIADAPAFRSQEGVMAEQEFTLSIDRRQLMPSVAAVGAASVVPGVERVHAAAPDFAQPSLPTPKAAPTNFSAATALRLARDIDLSNGEPLATEHWLTYSTANLASEAPRPSRNVRRNSGQVQ
jgi:hypothetical protein